MAWKWPAAADACLQAADDIKKAQATLSNIGATHVGSTDSTHDEL